MWWIELQALHLTLRLLAARVGDARDERGGLTTEAVILTAVLAALALGAAAIIVAKVTAKATSITLE